MISVQQIKECFRTELMHVIERDIDEGLNAFFNNPSSKFNINPDDVFSFNISNYNLSRSEIQHIKTLYETNGWVVEYRYNLGPKELFISFKMEK